MEAGGKRALHWLGSALAVAGAGFVILRLWDYGSDIELAKFEWPEWSLLGLLILAYAAANLFLALAWWKLLEHLGTTVSPRWATRAYGVSQLAKYVPGNVVHFASRQAMGIAKGVPAWTLAKSTVLEMGLLTAAGGLYGLLVLHLLLPDLPAGVGTAIFALACSGTGLALWRYLGLAITQAFACQIGFLAVSGVVFMLLAGFLTAGMEDGQSWWLVVGAFVLAWLAGLVTPGAPAGVGVRELVLLFLLHGMADEASLLLAVVLSRVVTVCGDLIFFAVAALIRPGAATDKAG